MESHSNQNLFQPTWTKTIDSIETWTIPLRLSKFLYEYGHKSQSSILDAWNAGHVMIRNDLDGHNPYSEVFEKSVTKIVFPVEDQIFWNNEHIQPAQQNKVYIALNKADGMETTVCSSPSNCNENTQEELPWKSSEHPDLSLLLKNFPPGTSPVGRLDKETSGLLLFTNDGDLNHQIRMSGNDVHKEYHLYIGQYLQPGDTRIKSLLEGVELSDGIAKAESITILQAFHPTSTPPQPFHIISKSDIPLEHFMVTHHRVGVTKLSVIICEGRNRIIRRMCSKVRLRLLHLHRHRVANITLDTVSMDFGSWGQLTPQEVETLWSMCGGKTMCKENKIKALIRIVWLYRKVNQPHQRLEKWFKEHNLIEMVDAFQNLSEDIKEDIQD